LIFISVENARISGGAAAEYGGLNSAVRVPLQQVCQGRSMPRPEAGFQKKLIV